MSRPKKHTPATFLKVPGNILYGSVAEVMVKCGKKNCCCHGDPSRRHGPYFQWTGFIHGKRTTVKLPSRDVAQECLRRIENYALLLKQVESLKDEAIETAPWLLHPP